MWKPLSIVSGVALLAGAGIMFSMVRPVFIAERKQVGLATENQEKARKQRTEAEAAVKTAETELTAIKGTLTKAEAERVAAAAKKDEAAKAVEAAMAEKETASKEIAELETKLKDLGGLDTLVADLKAQEAKRVEYDRQISTAKSEIESALARKASMDKQIAELKRIDQWQQSGTMAPTFRSRITAVNPDWGFVTIGAGNNASVVRQAKLDVVRGNSVVGRVIVTHVSPNSSAAEIVPGSVAPGDSILPGDQVKTGSGSLPSSQRPAPAAPAPSTPAKPVADAAPAAPAAPADPFATDAPPAAADPGTPPASAPETPAPVEPAPEAPAGQ